LFLLRQNIQSDNVKAGCFNTRCSGFIQTSRAFFVGSRVANTSTYGGTMIELKISLIQVIYLREVLTYIIFSLKKIILRLFTVGKNQYSGSKKSKLVVECG